MNSNNDRLVRIAYTNDRALITYRRNKMSGFIRKNGKTITGVVARRLSETVFFPRGKNYGAAHWGA